MEQEFDHLKRLSPEHYRGQAYVHWSQTIGHRDTGWLVPIVYYKFRELLTHTMFRFGLTCPIYCCMPDHIHMVWMGLLRGSDQLLAMKYFRKQMNQVLQKLGYRLQEQPYDRVLREDERIERSFEDLIEYIARNPERAGLVAVDEFKSYKFTSCLLPGYPSVSPWQEGFWELFWRIYAKQRDHGLVRSFNEDFSP